MAVGTLGSGRPVLSREYGKIVYRDYIGIILLIPYEEPAR